MNIYISGLNFSTTDADLKRFIFRVRRSFFCKNHYRQRNKKIQRFRFRRNAGRCSRPKNAIDELNGAEFDHKQISVNVARPPAKKEPSNGGNRDRRGGYNSRRY